MRDEGTARDEGQGTREQQGTGDEGTARDRGFKLFEGVLHIEMLLGALPTV